MKKTLLKKIQFQGTLFLKSGLHIGSSDESVQIGGIDKSVIRRKDNNQPYIPGSSLKGKIRCLLEQAKGAGEIGGNEEVNKVFGFSEDELPSKIIVRDAYLTTESADQLYKSEYTDFPYTEVKFENSIKRIQGTADNPRKIERVPVGSSFDIYFVLNVWDDDNELEMINLLKEGIQLLEADYLGGSGSRGYGQVSIEINLDQPNQLYPIPTTG